MLVGLTASPSTVDIGLKRLVRADNAERLQVRAIGVRAKIQPGSPMQNALYPTTDAVSVAYCCAKAFSHSVVNNR